MREVADFVVIDSPAYDRDDAAITLAPQVDLTIVVVAAEHAAPEESLALAAALRSAGGEVAGLVFNRARYDIRSAGRSLEVA
jgi:Mrp family chromosome partitioning ATPase